MKKKKVCENEMKNRSSDDVTTMVRGTPSHEFIIKTYKFKIQSEIFNFFHQQETNPLKKLLLYSGHLEKLFRNFAYMQKY